MPGGFAHSHTKVPALTIFEVAVYSRYTKSMSPNPETPQVTVESLPKLALKSRNGIQIGGRVSSLEDRKTGTEMIFQLSATCNDKCQVVLGNAQRVTVRHLPIDGSTEYFHFDRVTLEGEIPEVLMARVKAWVSRVLDQIHRIQVQPSAQSIKSGPEGLYEVQIEEEEAAA